MELWSEKPLTDHLRYVDTRTTLSLYFNWFLRVESEK
nr:MAG TPA: protein of unknown function (DUF4334) [Caudoviricetes sp.]